MNGLRRPIKKEWIVLVTLDEVDHRIPVIVGQPDHVACFVEAHELRLASLLGQHRPYDLRKFREFLFGVLLLGWNSGNLRESDT